LNRLTSGWSSANTGAYSWGENYSIDAWSNLQISPMGGNDMVMCKNMLPPLRDLK
jgi:hypothetical protein